MKTSSSSGVVNGGTGSRSMPEEKMEQVRDLLFGEFEKQTQSRVDQLEVRLRELETGLNRRLDALEARLEALSGEMDANQLTAAQEIADGLQELGERVRRIRGA